MGGRIKSRRQALGMSQAKLAAEVTGRGIKLSQQNIVSIESGDVKRPRALPEIASVLQTTIAWIRDGVGPEIATTPTEAPLQSTLPDDRDTAPQLEVWATTEGAADGAMRITTSPIDFISRPEGLPARGSFAVYLIGESMSPAYEHGDQLYVNTNKPVRAGLDCLFVQEMDDGTLLGLTKRLVESTPDKWLVKQFKPEKTFELDRRRWTKAWMVAGKMNRS